MWEKMRHHFFSKLITGTLVIVPLLVTYECLGVVFRIIHKIFIPLIWHWIGFSIPGLSLLLLLLLFYATGWIISRRLGKWILIGVLDFLRRLPVLSKLFEPLYLWVKAVVFGGGEYINEHTLVQFPMDGNWAIGFIIRKVKIANSDYLTVLVPTVLHPFIGWVVFQRQERVRKPSMCYQDAVKMVLSAGILSPERVL